MISDYVMTNINQHFRNKTALAPAIRPSSSRPIPTLTRELIKQSLPGLIRRNNDPAIVVNETRPKSPSPISKSRLKMVLESSKQESLRAVVKKSPAHGGQLTCKTSVSDLMDCKSSHGRSAVSEYEEEKENYVLEAYRQKRKAEQQREHEQKSLRKAYGKFA